MRRVFEFRAAWAMAIVVAGYVALAFVTPFHARGTGLRAVFLVLAFWGMGAYWRPARRAILSRGWPPGELLYALMVWLGCASYVLNMAVATLWRLSGQPAYIINNAVFDFWIVLGICALAIGVTVPDLFGKDVPPRDRLRLGTAWLGMAGLVAYLVLVQPNLRPFAEAIRPYIDMGHEYRDPD